MSGGLGFVADYIERRYYGVYYTPGVITRAMANWAIRDALDHVLEPSFGDGAFLHAAAERLRELGGPGPAPQIFGSDIDPQAVATVASSSGLPKGVLALRQADFLAIAPSESWFGLDAALGNPPYVRHHLIDRDTIADHRRRALGLPGGADLWCTFVLHTARFLRVGGRLAFVLPGAFLFARYAEQVRRELCEAFASTVVVRLAFRAFASSGADERGVIILCSGYRQGRSQGWIEAVAWSEKELSGMLAGLRDARPARTRAKRRPAWEDRIRVRPLGELAKVSIGFVTGANRIFIVDEKSRAVNALPVATLFPVVSRTAQTPGILFSSVDHDTAAARNEKVWLFAPASLGDRHGPVRRYLARVSRETRRNTLWFRKRPYWYQPEIGPRPDAVLTYMNHLGPRIILLNGAQGATNTFHAISFVRSAQSPQPAVTTLAMLTSYAQLSAERVGRSYGGGVLKIEPSEARQIALPIPERMPRNLDAIVAQADSLLKLGDVDGACRLADDTLLRPMLGPAYPEARAALIEALSAARSFRLHRTRAGSG